MSACNTPRKIHDISVDIGSGTIYPSERSKNLNLSRDLFSNSLIDNDLTKPNVQEAHDDSMPGMEKTKKPMEDFGDLMVRRLNIDYSMTSTPTQTPVKVGPANNASATKNTSNYSVGTPNRSGNSSRNSYSMRSQKSPNDSRSFDSSVFMDSPIVTPHRFSSHEKSRDRRSVNSPVCLSDFITAATAAKPKGRRSNNVSQEQLSPQTGTGHQQNVNRSSDKDFPAFTPKGKANRVTPVILSQTPKTAKPMKRVVPTLISSNRNDFSSSTFRSDNNILEISHEESDISRNLLKNQKDVIRRVFQDERQSDTSIRTFLQEKLSTKASGTITSPPIEMAKVTNRATLDRLIQIYAIIIDLNLITNVLTEIGFLVNLINVDSDQCHDTNLPAITGEVIDPTASISHSAIAERIFKNINNCVYFGLGVLKQQKYFLCLLDTMTLKVLLENERLNKFGDDMKDALFRIYTHKSQLELTIQSHDTSLKIGHSFQVFYQQEQDTKQNFPSAQEFCTFKKQRDAFYSILG